MTEASDWPHSSSENWFIQNAVSAFSMASILGSSSCAGNEQVHLMQRKSLLAQIRWQLPDSPYARPALCAVCGQGSLAVRSTRLLALVAIVQWDRLFFGWHSRNPREDSAHCCTVCSVSPALLCGWDYSCGASSMALINPEAITHPRSQASARVRPLRY